MWWKVFYHCALIIAIWEVQALQLFSPSCLVLEGPARIYFPFVDSFRNISFTNFTKEGNQLILKLKTLLYISSSPFVYLWLWGRARDWKIRRKKIRRIKHLLKSISPLYFWDENLPEIFKIKGTWNFFFSGEAEKLVLVFSNATAVGRRAGCIVRARSCLCFHKAECILKVSEEKTAERVGGSFQPLSKHQRGISQQQFSFKTYASAAEAQQKKGTKTFW